jgi:hypothetical protein
MSETCPYCGREYADKPYLYRHAMTDHREAVLSVWIDQHDVTPLLGGQQMFGQVMA